MMLINPKCLTVSILISMAAQSLSAADQSFVRIVGKGQGLSLAEAMDTAERESTQLKAQAAGQRGAQARVDQAGAGMGPKLSLEAQRGWIDTDINKLAGKTLPSGVRFPDNVNSAGLVLSQGISGWFVQNQRQDVEQHLLEAVKADGEASKLELRSRVAETFLHALKAARLFAIAQESLILIQKQKRDAELLKAEGKLAQLDFARFAFAESEAVTQRSDTENQLKIGLAQLREALHFGEDQEIALEDFSHQIPIEKNVAIQERAELRSAQERVNALQSSQSVARLEYFPNVQAFARFERDFAAKDIVIPIAGAPTYPMEDYRDKLSYGFSFNWVIWDGFARSAHSREMEAETERAMQQKSSLESNIRVEQVQSEAELDRVQQTLRNADVSAKLSEDIFHAFQAKFMNGLATTTDLLGAQRDLTRARAQLASAGYDLQLAMLRNLRARGSKI